MIFFPEQFSSKSLTVSDMTRYMRELIESDEILRDVWVQGEISNLSQPKSGHIYFTLKDDYASLKCVIWRTQAVKLQIALRDGQSIEAHGSIGVYEQGGQYQLYATSVRALGEGLLYQEFMRLKARLEDEGLFEPQRKRAIPSWPKKIGIVTSPTGAALQDMLNTLRQRFPLVEVTLAPCAVQGDAAPLEIVDALVALNRIEDLDVILVARGGGSLEDLWAFNDERVVRTVAASRIPIITGVGHETDFTLVDFVSDLRAPTPTGAAVLAVPNISDLVQSLASVKNNLMLSYQSLLIDYRDDLEDLSIRLRRTSPLTRIMNNRQQLDELEIRSRRAIHRHFQICSLQLQEKQKRLAALNPLSILKRGYAVVSLPDGTLVHSVQQALPGQEIQIQISDGKLNAQVKNQIGKIYE